MPINNGADGGPEQAQSMRQVQRERRYLLVFVGPGDFVEVARKKGQRSLSSAEKIFAPWAEDVCDRCSTGT
jgi:hypothetical protein